LNVAILLNVIFRLKFVLFLVVEFLFVPV